MHPCPICGKPDWCAGSADGAWALCRRVEVAGGKPKLDKAGAAYWVYRLDGRARDPGPALDLPSPPEAARADPATLDRVYRALLAALPLQSPHRQALHRRGLTETEMAQRQFGTLPAPGRAALARRLVERFGADACATVPGLYVQAHGTKRWWSLAGAVGLLVPVRDADGRIVALKVRADDPGDRPKYSYLSSTRYGGPGPGAQVHVPRHEGLDCHTVRLTEGELKADVATALSGMLTLAAPGVSHWRAALPIFTHLGAQTVRLAFDADARQNVHVAQALADAAQALATAGFTVAVEVWPLEHGKGIDDVLAAGHQPAVRTGADAWVTVRETTTAAGASRPAATGTPGDTAPGDAWAQAQALLTQVQEAPALAPVFAAVDLFATLSTSQWSLLKSALKTALGKRLNLNDLDTARREARRRRRVPAQQGAGLQQAPAAPALRPNGTLPLSDQTNAEALVRQHGADLRYCHPWKQWLVWDGTRWASDDTGEAMRRAKQTIKRLAAEAVDLRDDATYTAVLKHIKASLAAHRLQAMLTLATSEPQIPVLPQALDAHPWLLNCQNGVLDLRTGQLGPHHQRDHLTKRVPVAYDPAAPCPTWRAFLDRIMAGNAALISFLQRAVGYALTGDTREQCLLLLYGTGQNGKSTFVETLLALLGDYATQAEFSTFLLKPQDHGVRNDLAELRGARFVSAVEVTEGQRLHETLVKQLTGQDTVKARFLYQEFFAFTPQFKLFLACNHKPVIRGTEYAIWRRIRLVPFTVTIPTAEQDKTLPATLRQELPGILAWAVHGCLAWQQHGLGEPAAVQQATESYRREMDILGEFLDERCLQAPAVKAAAKDLYAAYTAWCEANGEPPVPQRAFGMRLTERGFTRVKSTGGRYAWEGIALAVDQVDEVDLF